MNRKKSVIKTALTGIIFNVISILLGFITQKVFIARLGIEYSGINSLFNSIIGILTMADIGVSSAVILNLYKPLANNDTKKVSALMNFYHKGCLLIGSIILIGCLLITPFIPNIVGKTSVDVNLYLVFIIFGSTASLSYFLNYKRPLLLADQKAFLINITTSITSLLTYSAKILILLTIADYYLFLVSVVFFRIIENTIINLIVDKRYPYLKEKGKLSKAIVIDIKKKIFASAFHNMGSYVVFSTDNIVLSSFFGVGITGIYSNYSLILNSSKSLVSQIFTGISASFGNIRANEGRNYLYVMTKRIMLLNFWISGIVSIALYYCLNPFISIWLGPDYSFDPITVFALCLNFFLTSIRASGDAVLSAGGILYENRFMPIIEASINIVSSIILAKLIGISGVFIGTVISNLFLHFYSYPRYAFGLVLKRKRREYLALFAKYLACFLFGWAAVYLPLKFADDLTTLQGLLLSGILSLLLPSLLWYLLFRKSEEYTYFINLIHSRLAHIKS